MHSSDEHLSSAGSKQRQSLPARSFTNYDEPKSNVQMKETSSSDEDEEDNSTLDHFDTNNDRFKMQHLSLDYDAGHLSPASAYHQEEEQHTPGGSKKGRSLSIASVLSPLSPSNSANFAKKNVPQFLTVSPTFTPRARPPPAYANNFAGGSRPALAGPSTSPRMNSPSPSRPVNPALAVSGQMPSFEAAKGGILGSATSQLLNSRSRHQSIGDVLKISTGNNQVLTSHLARRRESCVSKSILETLQSANAGYSGMQRRLIRGQPCYGSGSGPSGKYFSPGGRLIEGVKESYDEEQEEVKEPLDESGERIRQKKISIEAPLSQQRASILTTATTRTYTSGEEKENQIDEELLSSSKMEDTPAMDEHVKISIDASDKLSHIKETDDLEDRMSGEEPEAPTYSLGERVVWVKTANPEYGLIRWIGRMPKISSKWTVGLDLDNAIGNTDGNFEGKRYFTAKENYGKFVPLSSICKVEAYLARPRSGTLLSRVSVQLKPGQLISVQRTSSINHIPVHCALNAPHHIDHDVHQNNMQHCLCMNCNHPCAHLCKTKMVKGSKKKERAHMCHFSQRPHGKFCCGGEDLRQLIASGKLEKVGGLLQEVRENQIAVAASKAERMQALKQKTSQRSSSGSRISSQIGAHAVGSVGSAAIGAGFNTIVVGKQRRSGQSQFSSLTPPPPSPPAISPLPRSGLNPSQDSSTLGRESRRKTDRSSVGSRRVPSSSAPSSVERVSVCSLSSCSKREKHPMTDAGRQRQADDGEPKLNGGLHRSGSELSISSLPSSTSPVEVYIARGALTDESEYESDADNKQTKLNNLDKASHVGSHVSSKHSAINSYYSNVYPHHHRSAIRSMFACLVGRQHQSTHPPPTTYSISSKENYSSSQRVPSNYYYDAALDGCVRRKKTKKAKKKSNKKKRCKGPNNYCYYCTSHNYPSSASQAPSRTSNQSTTTTLQTGQGSHHSNRANGNLPVSGNLAENASLASGRNAAGGAGSGGQMASGKSHHLNVKNSYGLTPSPEPDSQQALLSNYSDRSSCHSGHSNHHSINSSNYKDYITNYCSKTSSYNHDCHPECSRKSQSSQNDLPMRPDTVSLSSAGRVVSAPRSHTSSPMQISCSPPRAGSGQNLSNAIVVTAETHQHPVIDSQIDLGKPCSTKDISDLGELVNTKDPQPLTEQIACSAAAPSSSTAAVAAAVNAAAAPTQMDFVEQLHQFQQQYLKQHPEIMQMSTMSSGTKQDSDKSANWKKDASAQDKANVVATKKFTQPSQDTANIVHKQRTADSSSASINLSSSSRADGEQAKEDGSRRRQKRGDERDGSRDRRSTSRPSSRTSEHSKKESESSSRATNALNQSTQSIQSGRPESKRSNRTDLSSNADISKRSADGHDSTTNSILSLNSTSLGAGRSHSIATSSELASVNSAGQLNQSETSISSASNNKTATTLPRRTAATVAESTATSTTSITSTTSQTASSSATSGIVTSSPIRRRKKPPAPKPPTAASTANLSTRGSSAALAKQSRASKTSSTTLNHNASSKVPSNASYSNAALSHSNSSLMTADTFSSCLSANLTSEVSASSAEINSLRRKKKSSKSRPAPPVPVLDKQTNREKPDGIKLANDGDNALVEQQNALNKARSSSCSKQLNKRINNSLRLTPHKTPCMSVNHRNKSNVKLRLNAILNRSLSEAFRLNAKAALNRQHSFSSEVSLNKRNLSTMINNTAFCSFGQNEQQNHNNSQHRTPDAKRKLEELEQAKKNLESLKTGTKDLKKSDVLNKPDRTDAKKADAKLDNKQINNWPANNTQQPSDQCNQIEFTSPFASSVMDRSFINSNRLVNQLFTTQPKSVNQAPVRRSSSLPYLAFWTAAKSGRRTMDKHLGYAEKTGRNGRKRTSAMNVASDLIIETLSKNLSNGSADQLLYAASLLEEFSESVIAVPPLSSALAALLSPQHYQKHNLNNQLLLINHYIDCLKHEQEQEELLTVQLIEQQQVNRMMIEINKESLKDETSDRPEISTNETAESDKKKEEEDVKLDRKTEERPTSKPNPTDKITSSKAPVVVATRTPSKSLVTNRTAILNGHESTSDELHSDTSDGKVTVKCMPTNRLQELSAATTSKPASSSGLSNSSSKTLLAEHPEGVKNVGDKRKAAAEHPDRVSNLYSINKNAADRHATAHHSHHCSNKSIHCSHSTSTHCLNAEQEHSLICHQFAHSDESSSSSSQSTRSTEDLNWSSKHQAFRPCPSIGLRLNSHLNSHLNGHHAMHPTNSRQYLLNAVSSSECSTDESCSVDSPMLLHLHHHSKNFLAHQTSGFSALANPEEDDDDLVCACCCEHRTHLHRSGAIPSGKAGAYLFEPGGKQHQQQSHGAGGNYNNNQEAISNLYDYHSLHLTDMFNAESSVLINQELTELMEQLEFAISSGEHKRAALLARELALRKVACTLQRSTQANNISAQPIVVYLYIDLNNHVQGPIPMQLNPTMTVRALKLKVEKEYGFDASIQKWILGKSLATNEEATLYSYGISISGCPIFLYLFNSDELYQPHHHFLTDSLPSLVELNEELTVNDEPISERQPAKNRTTAKRLDKKLSASLDTSLGSVPEKTLNKRLDASLDTNLNRNKTLDRRSSRKQQQQAKQPTSLIDEMLDCKFDDELSELLPPPIDFQSDNETAASARFDLMGEPLIRPLIDTSDEPINWVNNKLQENLNTSVRQFRRSSRTGEADEPDQYESASEELGEGHSIEEDRSIEEIVIEEEVYELNDRSLLSSSSSSKASTSKVQQSSNQQGYKDLIKLDDLDLVTNKAKFECSICLNEVAPEGGVVLKECLHSFCKDCLINCVQHCEQPPVHCPFDDDQYHCESELSLREIRALFGEQLDKYEQFLKKSVKLASLRPSTDNLVFLCKTPDCDGFCYYEDEKNTKWFCCPLCSVLYCLKCQRSSELEGHQCGPDGGDGGAGEAEQAPEKELSEEEKKSERFIQEMIEKGQAIHCPKCNVVQIKKWGCDLIKCTMCKTEICWITRKCRWGPKGKGDTSDGCKCMVNNKKCHPRCNYCH